MSRKHKKPIHVWCSVGRGERSLTSLCVYYDTVCASVSPPPPPPTVNVNCIIITVYNVLLLICVCVYEKKKQTVYTVSTRRWRRERHGISVFFFPALRSRNRGGGVVVSQQVIEPRSTSFAIDGGGTGANKRGRVPGIYLTAAVAFAVDISSRPELQLCTCLWKRAGRKGQWVGRGGGNASGMCTRYAPRGRRSITYRRANNPFPRSETWRCTARPRRVVFVQIGRGLRP